MGAAIDNPPARGQRPRVRYSLRALLVAFTLACIGVGYWYRWPYQKVIVYGARGRALWTEGQQPIFLGKEIQRYRRVLRGEPLREGLTEYFALQGQRVGEDHWREDRLHGPFVRWYTSGAMQLRGQYEMGRQQGVWEQFDDQGRLELTAEYDRDLPHGTWRWYESGRVALTIRFEEGEAIELDGQPASDHLGIAVRRGIVDAPVEAAAIRRLYSLDLPAAPLHQLRSIVQARSELIVTIDPRSNVSLRTPTPLVAERLPLNACFLVALAGTDLAATYRHGGIWITTKTEAARGDATGVESLLPQVKGTGMEEKLKLPISVALEDADARTALAEWGRATGLTLTPVGDSNAAPLTLQCQLPARHVLGLILDHFQLRVRRNGQWGLQVEPQAKR
jgi:hypothetical protein